MQCQKKEGVAQRRMVCIIATTIFTLLVSGCMVGPDFCPPDTKTPAGWTGVSKEASTQPSTPLSAAPDIERWWGTLKEPTLSRLIDEALRANLDIQFAQASLRQARATRCVVVGGLFPAIAGNAAYTREGFGGGSRGGRLFQRRGHQRHRHRQRQRLPRVRAEPLPGGA